MVHRAKVDVWILAAILFAVAVLLLGANRWIVGPVLLTLAISAYPQSYVTTPEGLLVRTGVSRTLILYGGITFIGPESQSEGAFWSPGNVCIQYGHGSQLVIAPADPAAFFADMAVRAPHLAQRGRKLVAALA